LGENAENRQLNSLSFSASFWPIFRQCNSAK